MYLLIDGDNLTQQNDVLTQDQLLSFDNGELDIVRFNNGKFERPVLTVTEDLDQDEEDDDVQLDVEITSWSSV